MTHKWYEQVEDNLKIVVNSQLVINEKKVIARKQGSVQLTLYRAR